MKRSLRRLLAVYFLPAMILVNAYSLGTLWYIDNPMSQNQAIAIQQPQPLQPTITQGVPARIIVSGLNINLPVETGTYNPANNSWTLTATKAYYANLTVPVNDKRGNTLIYGHNNRAVFAAVEHVKPGMTAEVVTAKGDRFIYEYTASSVVEPNDLRVFDPEGPPRLTLQTCTGAWFEQRHMAEFKLTGVVKAPVSPEEKRAILQHTLKSLTATPDTTIDSLR